MPESMSVTYGRRLADGDGGHEELAISITQQFDADELVEEALRDGLSIDMLVARVRSAVLDHLSMSEAPRVAAVARAELLGKEGRAWGESNAATEEHAILHMDDADQEALPF